MAVIITDINSPVDFSDEEIIESALKKAGIKRENIIRAGVYKTSLDARKRNDIHKVSSVWAELSGGEEKLSEKKFISEIKRESFSPITGDIHQNGKIAVIGFGPAGMFAALTLARYGYKPVVFERGQCVDERVVSVENFMRGGVLSVSSNVQFGEGGAGTFSDGKLTTRIHDPLCRYVLESFAEMGAPDDILTKAKPHIGTDKLRVIVKNIREKIISLGGEVRFDSCVTDFDIRNNVLTGITVNGTEKHGVCAAVLAVGHSARDTFSVLSGKNILLEPKPFSVGARIEHKKISVNESLYGKGYSDTLPEGEYQLSYRKNGRGVYTFCMCPGGYVMPSQSEEKTIVTNGMSEYARNGENSNSAVVVSVTPDDFGNSPLDGVKFARDIERRAYELTGSYSAPACTVGSFLDGTYSLKGKTVSPSYPLGVSPVSFDKIFPSFVTEMMREGLVKFSKKMRCFGDRGAVLTAPETRTSSPVRITRNDRFTAVGTDGLYPCGEGAGYAGGIMSAAVDGVRTAEKIIKIYKP